MKMRFSLTLDVPEGVMDRYKMFLLVHQMALAVNAEGVEMANRHTSAGAELVNALMPSERSGEYQSRIDGHVHSAQTLYSLTETVEDFLYRVALRVKGDSGTEEEI